MKQKTSDILLQVQLDTNKIPEKLFWTAQDGGINHQECKAFLLSIWDSNAKETLRMDLWTKDMPLDEMKMFFYQTFVAMADTYLRATDDAKMTETIRDFAQYFGENTEVLKKND